MKLAIDCRMIDCSGIGTFLKGILPYIIKNREFECMLIGDRKSLSEFETERVCILNCNIPIFSLKEILCFPVKEVNKCDIFFSPNYNIPARIKVPIFATIHDVLFLDFPEITSGIGHFIRKLAIDRTIRISKHIFTVSEFSKNRILHHSHKIKSISVCYNGADHMMKNTNFPVNSMTGKYFIYVGNIKPHKGLNTLLDAFESPKVQKLGKKLVIVGNKDAFKTTDRLLSHRIAALSEKRIITFTGFINDDSLINLMKNAYCLVQPSQYEGFGLPPLEAMQIGTPVILSDIPVFKELYKNFPVIYFKTSNVASLIQAMVSPLPRINLPENLKDSYTYRKTANIILSDIKTCLLSHESSSIR